MNQKKVILQNILFPSDRICSELELYFHGCENTEISVNKIRADKKTIILCDTYFNSFSIDKWKEYTCIENLFLTVKISGNVKIKIFEQYFYDNKLVKNKTGEYDCFSELPKDFSFRCTGRGMIAFEIECIDNSVFYGGYYYTDINEESFKYVKISAVICTYKREKFLMNNLEIISDALLDNKNSPLYDRLEVFISDNGGTIELCSLLDSNKIHLFKNKNTGGSGGFTRGIIETLKFKEKHSLTHILLMDDDIVVSPETLYRTWILLSLRNEKYENAFIGGSMLRLDRRYEQTESGALWNKGDIISLKYGYDLRNTENCIQNETDENAEYQAWWYCGFPISIVNENNLPMPFFIRGDDVEYGLRNTDKLMLINGVCVWHEPFENKYSSFLYYYIIRNELINNSVYHLSISKDELKKYIKRKVIGELLVYRYRNAELILRAVEDFLGGIAFLKNTDAEKLNQDILNIGYKLVSADKLSFKPDIDELNYNSGQAENLSFGHRIVKKLTFNGLVLPCRKKFATVPVSMLTHISVYRVKNVCNYDKKNQVGFITKRSFKSTIKSLKEMNRIFNLCDKNYDNAVKDFSQNSNELCKLSFWEKYLGLDEKK